MYTGGVSFANTQQMSETETPIGETLEHVYPIEPERDDRWLVCWRCRVRSTMAVRVYTRIVQGLENALDLRDAIILQARD